MLRLVVASCPQASEPISINDINTDMLEIQRETGLRKPVRQLLCFDIKKLIFIQQFPPSMDCAVQNTASEALYMPGSIATIS